uniref:Uncharacterized protein n=1 Tax=Arundo donax TaxID=35708 RepID=A0A0A9CPQ9_ARUDO
MEFISFVPLSSLVAWWPQLAVACSPGRRLAGRYVTPFDDKPRHPRICVAHACLGPPPRRLPRPAVRATPGPPPCRHRGPPTVHLLRPLRSSTSPDLSPSSSPRAPPSARPCHPAPTAPPCSGSAPSSSTSPRSQPPASAPHPEVILRPRGHARLVAYLSERTRHAGHMRRPWWVRTT